MDGLPLPDSFLSGPGSGVQGSDGTPGILDLGVDGVDEVLAVDVVIVLVVAEPGTEVGEGYVVSQVEVFCHVDDMIDVFVVGGHDGYL